MNKPRSIKGLIKRAPNLSEAMRGAGFDPAERESVMNVAPGWVYGAERLVEELRGRSEASSPGSGRSETDLISDLVKRQNAGLLHQGELPFGPDQVPHVPNVDLIDFVVEHHPSFPAPVTGEDIDMRAALMCPDRVAWAVDWLSDRAITLRRIADRANLVLLSAVEIKSRTTRRAAAE